MVSMESIKPLSEAVLSTVRSGFIISSLTTIIEELIYNSLDAGARKVLVLVGVHNGYIKVEDDGCGISRDGLVMVGERYATSKCHRLNWEDKFPGTFGFRGEVLCSVADTSLVEIATRVRGRPNGYRKVMKGRKCLYLSIDDRQDVGTTVIVRDLFYNQPVRRRQMQSSAKKALHSVRECALRIALVQPDIFFKIVDMESEAELLCTHASPSPLSLLHSSFGIDASSLCELKYSDGLLKLTGYVTASSSSLSSKAVQYIYINSRFVVKGPIHKALNRLADMCWDQSRGNNCGKRSYSVAGPSYCLNLGCPRSSYDLNIEVSGTSVEFKDWAPVLGFFEKSVAFLWSTRKTNGEPLDCEDDLIQKAGIKKVVGSMISAEKDWGLEDCKLTTKRRRIHSSDSDKEYAKASLHCIKMQVEANHDLSIWQDCCGQPRNSDTKTVKFGEPEMEREYPLCDTNDICLWKPDKGCLSLDENLTESDTNSVRREWNEQIRADNMGAVGKAVGTGWNFGIGQEIDSEEANHVYGPLLLKSHQRFNKHQTPSDRKSGFRFDFYEGTTNCGNSVGSGNLDGQREEVNTWLLPKLSEENHVYEDMNLDSMNCFFNLPSYGASFGTQHTEPLEQVRGFSSSCFSGNSDRHPAISNAIHNDLEHENLLVKEDGLCGPSILGNCYTFHLYDDEKEELCHDDFSSRCLDEDLSSTSSLKSELLFGNDDAVVGKGVWDEFAHECRADAGSSLTHRDSFLQELHLPLNNINQRELSVCWSPSISINKGVHMGLQRCQALKQPDFPQEEMLRNYHRHSPDSLISVTCDDNLAAEIAPSYLGFKSKSTVHEPLGHCVSSVSLGEGLDVLSCQPSESNHSLLEQARKIPSRTRSFSAPPVYRGKRRFLSLYDCVISASENPVLQTLPQARRDKERDMMEVPHGPPSLSDEHLRDDDMSTPKDSISSSELQVQAPNVAEGTWSHNFKARGPCFDTDNSKEVNHLESFGVKWRDGQLDTALEGILKRVGDRLDDRKYVYPILDVQMLPLVGDSLVPNSINRSCLESAKVLFQVDSKFIPVVAKGTIAVIDQHAADERIRLEEMRRKVLSGELTSISYLEEEKDLALPEIAFQLLCNYAEHVKHWGWICNIFREDSASFAKSLHLLNEQATHLRLIAVPCVLGVDLSDADLLEFLEQLGDTDGSSQIPPSVVRVLNYKACRGAIMFGDKLLPSECSLIVEELKRTSLCFQCAHGRPTTVPLVNLKALHKGISQLESLHEGSNRTWHGLCRKNINLWRARRRLDAAKGC